MDQVLLLDTNYMPLQPVSWKRALTLVLGGRAETLEESGRVARTVTVTIPIPSVIRLIAQIGGKKFREPALCRNSIIRRDGGMCQYCKKKFQSVDLTVDHVIPKVRGGEFKWENLVAACKPCNNKKGDRTPKEAGMTLNKKPRRPGAQIQFTIDERWKKWLPLHMTE